MKVPIFIFFIVLILASPCIAGHTYIDVVCPSDSSTNPQNGYAPITFKQSLYIAMGHMQSNLVAFPVYYDTSNRFINVPCRCTGSTTRIELYGSTTVSASSGTFWVLPPDKSPEGSLELVSLIIGALAGLAFAVASVFKF